MTNYHRAEYEDIAAILKRVDTRINSSLLSPNEIMDSFRNEFISLFETKGQSFNKTRFLNAVKVEELTNDQEATRQIAIMRDHNVAGWSDQDQTQELTPKVEGLPIPMTEPFSVRSQ